MKDIMVQIQTIIVIKKSTKDIVIIKMVDQTAKFLEYKVVIVFEYQVINQLENMVIIKMTQKDIIIDLGFKVTMCLDYQVIKVLNKVENQLMELKEEVVEVSKVIELEDQFDNCIDFNLDDQIVIVIELYLVYRLW
ncbi:MAG: hypothetical protein EZS28_040593 [Streblomastix strix]|uniref:Uncharacterized protein n=1 Tax=Streblomastix strix TaxID=222440 RepID=A0A5J4U142_9EUKA|nr:MAG: hypothetical protein EZS28_040593 [Streblomastix strix]